MKEDGKLIEKFIASFETLAENLESFEGLDSIAAHLETSPADELGQKRWKPVRSRTEPNALEPL